MIISFAGQKGGTGKTTTAIATASELQRQGLRVLLVDADPQGSTRTWGDVACERGLPSPTIVAMGATMHQPGQLDALSGSYDAVVIDCPPRHGETMKSALLVSDLVVFPCGPSAMDGWALTETLDVLNAARSWRPALDARVLITRKTRTGLGRSARDTLAAFGVPILRTELGHRVTYQEAPAAGQGVTTYAPRSAAAIEIRALIEELQEPSSEQAHVRAA